MDFATPDVVPVVEEQVEKVLIWSGVFLMETRSSTTAGVLSMLRFFRPQFCI